jgi:hypothetical protein
MAIFRADEAKPTRQCFNTFGLKRCACPVMQVNVFLTLLMNREGHRDPVAHPTPRRPGSPL